VTVPPAWKALDRVAESVIDWPTLIAFGDREVVIVGLAFCTVKGSQLEVAALLFTSPPYNAFQLNAPAELKA
jgi:hypothetical protein